MSGCGCRKLVDKQAEDEGLWFEAATAPEAYLQQELRQLHVMIEEGCPLHAAAGQMREALGDTLGDMMTAVDLLAAMLNEDGNSGLDWNSPGLKGTVGWEIRELGRKYKAPHNAAREALAATEAK